MASSTTPIDKVSEVINREHDVPTAAPHREPGLLLYLLSGVFLGIVFTKSEVISWFRIQEMFRFDSFHMYGIIGSAIAVAALSIVIVKQYRLKTFRGEPIEIPPKELGERGYQYWIGGTVFGLGWALLGACPGPMYALIGTGLTVMVVALASGILGTFAYGVFRHRLPH